jgi:hypothetical protein
VVGNRISRTKSSLRVLVLVGLQAPRTKTNHDEGVGKGAGWCIWALWTAERARRGAVHSHDWSRVALGGAGSGSKSICLVEQNKGAMTHIL